MSSKEKRGWFIITAYFTDEDKPILEEMEKIAKRERRSRSSMVVLALKEYVERHGSKSPNFQQTLDNHKEGGEKSIAFIKTTVFNKALEYAKNHRSEVYWKNIVIELREVGDAKKRIGIAEDIVQELLRLKIKVVR